MASFRKAVVCALISLVVVVVFAGFAFHWNWNQLSDFGQFVGGVASALALALVAYGLIIQQNEYSLSIAELKHQTETLRTSNEAQLFNVLYSTLIHRSDDFSYVDTRPNPPIDCNGITALECMADIYLRHCSYNNLRPLHDRRSSIEAFVRAFLQVLKFLRSIGDSERKRLLAELVINQFISPIRKIVEIENSPHRIEIDQRVLKELHTVAKEFGSSLT